MDAVIFDLGGVVLEWVPERAFEQVVDAAEGPSTKREYEQMLVPGERSAAQHSAAQHGVVQGPAQGIPGWRAAWGGGLAG